MLIFKHMLKVSGIGLKLHLMVFLSTCTIELECTNGFYNVKSSQLLKHKVANLHENGQVGISTIIKKSRLKNVTWQSVQAMPMQPTEIMACHTELRGQIERLFKVCMGSIEFFILRLFP